MPASLKDLVFETGVVTTDVDGQIVITLDCFRPDEVPCVILSTFDSTGNVNANLTDLALAGSVWTAKIITSAPNTQVQYRAIPATAGDALSMYLITQDLIDILTQNNQQIQIQIS